MISKNLNYLLLLLLWNNLKESFVFLTIPETWKHIKQTSRPSFMKFFGSFLQSHISTTQEIK